MIEPVKCACGHIPAKIRILTGGPTSAFGWSCVCGLACENALSYEQSVVNWNTLCEQIRLGKEAMDMAPDEEVTVGISGITTECIPAPLTMDNVLRDCALEIDAHMGDHKGLLAKINTVLSQGERHDCED